MLVPPPVLASALVPSGRPQIETPLGSMGFSRSLLGPAQLFLIEFESDQAWVRISIPSAPNSLSASRRLIGITRPL